MSGDIYLCIIYKRFIQVNYFLASGPLRKEHRLHGTHADSR